MMHRYLSILLGAAISLAACETVVEVDLPQEAPKLVANSIVQADSTVKVLMSQSQSVLNHNEIKILSGVDISLYEEDNLVATFEEINQSGYYQSSYPSQAGHTYTLRASKAGFAPIEATTLIPTPIPIQDLQYDTIQTQVSYYDEDGTFITEQSSSLNEMWLSIDDPPGENNFYEISVNRYVTYYQGDYNEDGEYIITDSSRQLLPIFLSSNDPIVTENDFFEDEGAFNGTSLLFTDEIFAGKSYTINFQIESSFYNYNEDAIEYFVILRTLNESFYRYRQSAELQQETEDNPFAEPVPVFNNIQGGYGIFAGYSTATKIISLEE